MASMRLRETDKKFKWCEMDNIQSVNILSDCMDLSTKMHTDPIKGLFEATTILHNEIHTSV